MTHFGYPVYALLLSCSERHIIWLSSSLALRVLQKCYSRDASKFDICVLILIVIVNNSKNKNFSKTNNHLSPQIVENEIRTTTNDDGNPGHFLYSLLFVLYVCQSYYSLVLCVCFVDRCLFFCTFSFRHCVFCSSSIYGFWLHLWYLQARLQVQ